MAFLSIQDLCFSYDQSIGCIKLPNLSLEKGQCCALVGASGCGKSTMLECIGLLQQNYSANQFILDNQDVLKLEDKQKDLFRLQNISFMPQNLALLPFLSIKENFSFQIKLLAKHASLHQKQVMLDELMYYAKILSIDMLLDKKPHQISLGQRQRASFIKALACDARLLLIDEPTSALDQHNAIELFKLICNVCKAKQICSIIVTHDTKLVSSIDNYQYNCIDNDSVFIKV